MDQSTRHGSKVLYITYDGLADPLGRSQILPYLTGLGARGHRITVLSCEKPALFRRDAAEIAALCDAAGIDWQPLRYHKKPPILSGAFDTQRLKRAAIRLHKAQHFDLVHCRSYLAAAAGLALKRRCGVRFLFDMRGFWPDECVERGSWPVANPLYRTVYAYMKRLEARLLNGADHIISLTEVGVERLRELTRLAGGRAPVTVIPCCADFEHFPLISQQARAEGRLALGIAAEARVLLHLGAVGSCYMLEETFDFFAAYLARFPAAILLFVTHGPKHRIAAVAASRGIDPGRVVVREASRPDVPKLSAAADAGIFFIRQSPSTVAISPTRLGEMIALGLPIITNGGIADSSDMVERSGCGVVIDSFDAAAYAAAIARLEQRAMTPSEIRASGRGWYDLAEGTRRYDEVYRALSTEAPLRLERAPAAPDRARAQDLQAAEAVVASAYETNR